MTYAFDFASVLSSWPQFLEGAWMTILLSFPATVIGFVGGTLLAIGRRSDKRWLVRACGAYVEILRNILYSGVWMRYRLKQQKASRKAGKLKESDHEQRPL